MTRKKWIGVSAAVVVGFGLLALIYSSVHKSVDICTLCGEMQTVRKVQIPRTKVTIFTFTRAGQSMVGKVLNEGQLVADHAHNWKMIYSIGNGQKLVQGEGRRTEYIFESADVSNYVQAISGFQSRERIAKYLAVAQQEDPNRSGSSDQLPPAAFVNEQLIEGSGRKQGLEDIMGNKPTDAPSSPK